MPPTVICKLLLRSHLPVAPPRPPPFLHPPQSTNSKPYTTHIDCFAPLRHQGTQSKLPHHQHAATEMDCLAQKHATQASPLPFVWKTSSHPSSTHWGHFCLQLPSVCFCWFSSTCPTCKAFAFDFHPRPFHHDPSLWPFTLGTFLSSTKPSSVFHQPQLSTFPSSNLQLSINSQITHPSPTVVQQSVIHTKLMQ